MYINSNRVPGYTSGGVYVLVFFTEDVPLVDLSTLYLLACQVRVNVGDSDFLFLFCFLTSFGG